jgi:hypothetical protein
MAGSEIAHIRETIAREYMAAKWGLTGFAQGTAKHEFISARMGRIEEGRQALEAHVGDRAIALVAETLDAIPEKPTRHYIQEVLRHEFGNTEDTQYLLNDLTDVWKTFDLLIELFSMEDAQKMINAPPA